MLSAWSKIDQRENSVGIYGYDVMIDTDFKMWLLEINLCPTMEHSTKVTKRLVPQMMEDLVKVIIDQNDPTIEQKVKSTGGYELIFETQKIKEVK